MKTRELKVIFTSVPGMGLGGKLRRPMRVEWQKPNPPALLAKQRKVLQAVESHDLFVQKRVRKTSHYDGTLAEAFLATDAAFSCFSSRAFDWHDAVYLFNVAMRYQPNNAANFALALANALPDVFGDSIERLTMAAYLHGMKVITDGFTFSFVAGFLPFDDELVVGVRLTKDADCGVSKAILDSAERMEIDSPMLGGEYFFCVDWGKTNENYFHTGEEIGIGFILLNSNREQGDIFLRVVQESIRLGEVERQAKIVGGQEYRRAKQLLYWKYLMMGIIESLSQEMGYLRVMGREHPNKRFEHLYRILFSNRLDASGRPSYRYEPSATRRLPSYWVLDVPKSRLIGG